MKFLLLFVCLPFIVTAFPSNTHHKPTVDDDDAELAGAFEGDILLTEEQLRLITSPPTTDNGKMDFRYRWPNNTLPYFINESHFTTEQVDYIRVALDVLESVTCLKFVPRTDETDYVYVKSDGGGCYSNVGRLGGRQNLNLQQYDIEKGCFRKFTIVHEFIHALGFYHMQSAANRDDYVRVVWDKIRAGTENNFNKYNWTVISDFGVEYDYGSVMHYGRTGFSIDGSDTIVPIRNQTAAIGQRSEISASDILKINRMYGCPIPEPPVTNPELPITTPETPTTKSPTEIITGAIEQLVRGILGGILGRPK